MTDRTSVATMGRPAKKDIFVPIGFLAIVLFFVASGWISYWNVSVFDQDSRLVVRTHQIITAFDDLLSSMKDAETGQRGFLITGEAAYLAPYDRALSGLGRQLDALNELTQANPGESARLLDEKALIQAKLSELAETISLRRTKGFDAARAVVLSDRGKREMDDLRDEIDATRHEQEDLRNKRLVEMASAYRVTIVSGVLACLLGLLLTAVLASLVRRATAARRRQDWLQAGHIGLSGAMFGEPHLERLADNLLGFLVEYTGALGGAFFIEDGPYFRRVSAYGVPEDSAMLDRFSKGDGLLGQAVKDNRTFLIHDIPDGYLTLGSAFGKGKPRHLIIAPANVDGIANAVVELGFLQQLNDLTLELLENVAGPIGMSVRSAKDRAKLQNLLEETQRQGEELQAQSEELRVSNEELEEQTRALKESQSKLEQQQVELEQTNAELEEQAQTLENQRDDLARTKSDLENQAKDLERTSRFKSDFLANMSHELRTPLNSSLILAKLLADNQGGNLTAEQVKYAQTIQTSGNDLLALINDILDLSKIEAGHMELHAETVRIDQIVAALSRTFEPIAAQKSLAFHSRIGPNAPEAIVTDPQRIEQVLKNLLSNAMKFTAKGQVTMDVDLVQEDLVAFSVSDTGIGIPVDQQQMVFEAFRQADGTTNRKYGGTGLGLSISRELAHLLGGDITLESESGKGSKFTLRVPRALTAPPLQPQTAEPAPVPPNKIEPQTSARPKAQVADDRELLTEKGRLILVVEDDESFARILYDLAHEQGFQCLIAVQAEEALSLASQFLPSGVLLDIGLPDHSGLSVLDRLKHEGRTRHIPVHVISGRDNARAAMSLGAIGYMLKPVKREEIIQAFQGLEERLTQRMRRVLIVEDDPTQIESLRLLLGSQDVETVAAAGAAECLDALQKSTFDCMVLDLGLPDGSGFDLLDTLSQGEDYAFPPVIIYTGRDLTSEQEQRLLRHSKSIIVKGAKSPERLLDEVTLFLHQVVADLPPEKQRLLERAKHRDAALEERTILIVEDDVRNIFAVTSILEPRGAKVEIARNGLEALQALDESLKDPPEHSIDLVLMDIMMPEMDGIAAIREIRKRPEWKKLPIIALTAKATEHDQKECLEAGANDYIAKPLDVEKLMSLVRVWMPRR